MDADTAATAFQATVGQTINYTYTLENTGNVALDNVLVVDDNGTPGLFPLGDDLEFSSNPSGSLEDGIRLTGGDNNGNLILDPGETWQLTADPQTAQSGLVTNTAIATGSITGVVTSIVEDTDTGNYVGTDAPTTGNITIIKDADVKDGTDFSFSGDLGNFTLDDANPDDNDGVSNSATFNDITAGSVSVEELAAAGFDLNDIQISGDDDNGSVIDVANGTVNIDLDPGENITVTFENTQEVVTPTTGNITVVKDADVEDGTNFHFSGDLGNFTLDDANPDDNDGVSNTATFNNITAGSYSVEELAAAGFDLNDIQISGDDDNGSVIDVANGTVDIDLDPGEDITVTFENMKEVVTPPTGNITVVKDADVEDGTNFHFSGDLGNFSLDDANPDDNDGVNDTQTFSNVTAGSYSVSEGSDPNFDLSNIVINGDSDNGSVIDVANGTVDIDLDPGEDITVTFLNSKRVVDPDNEITGTDGMEMLHGTSGRDIITGLKGMDMMAGGAGNDDFVFNNIAEGLDYISDFETGADRLILTNLIDSLGSPADPIGDGFINLLDLGGATGTLLQVDPDGSAGGAGPVNLVLLEQVSAANSNALDPDNDLVF